MMHILVTALLATSAAIGAHGNTNIKVGSITLNIPPPQGYTLVTKNMGELSRASKQFVPSTNVELATFVPNHSAAVALSDHRIPYARRYFRIQISRSNIHTTASDRYFSQLKDLLKHNIRDVMYKVATKFPNIFTQSEINIAKKYGLYLAHAKLNVIPLPHNRATKHSFSYSILIKINQHHASTAQQPLTITATATLVHVKGKVLFMYCYSMDNNLQWSQRASREWAAAVISENQ